MSDLGMDPVSDPSPPPSDPTPEKPAADDGVPGISQENKFGNAKIGGNANFINNAYFEKETIARRRHFTADDDIAVTDEEELEITTVYAGDQATIDHLLDELEERRVLLLTGDPHIGKGATALYLGTRIADRRDLEQSTLFVTAPERQVIEIDKMARDAKQFGKRATVFTDAFSITNRELVAFFARAEGFDWQRVTATLRKNRAYLIFTSSNEQASFRNHAAKHIAFHELAKPLPELVEQAFDRRIAWIETHGLASSPERIAIVRHHRSGIIDELECIPYISAFLMQFVRSDRDIESALREFNDAPHWFRTELASDVDAWCAATALVIGQPARDSEVPWLDFERLRRSISDRVKEDEEMFPRGLKSTEDDASESDSARNLSDEALLARSRATISKDSQRLCDVVQFQEKSLAKLLWRTLLESHRRVLTQLVPLLREFSEKGRTTGRTSLRILATQALGRIGEIDPVRITMPLIRHWSVSEREQRPMVGRLLQGVIAADNDAYLDASLRELDQLLDSPNEEAALTVISAYSQIGAYKPKLAMQRLGAIAVERITPALDNIHQLSRVAETLGTQAELRSGRSAATLRVHGEQLGMLAETLSEEHAPALVALARAVSFICINSYDNTVNILAFMREWIARGGDKTGILVAILFLPDGIATELDEFNETTRDGDGDGIHPLLLSLSTNEGAGYELADFLVDLWMALSGTFEIPASLQRELVERLLDCLTTWAREAVTNPLYRDGTIGLFLALTTVRGRALRKEIVELLAGTAFRDDERMRTFADDIRSRIRR